MEPKSIKDVDQRVKGLYTKAQEAARQHNLDYAIEMFNTALKFCPEFREARQELRKVELEKINHKISGARQAWITTKNTIALNIKGPSLIKKGSHSEAMQLAESILANDPTISAALKLLAKAAEEADMEWLAIDTLEFLTKFNTSDIPSMRWLVELYLDNSRGEEASSVCRKMMKLDPNNGEYQSILKNAMARQAMDKSSWMNENGPQGAGTGAPSASSSSSTRAPIREEVARDKESAEAIVDKYIQSIESGQDSVDIRKKLARALIKADRYDEAIKHLQQALQSGGQVDPSLQNMIYQAAEGRFEAAIAAWEKYSSQGDAEGAQAAREIASLEQQKSDFLLQKARERSQMYSNDPNVNMELALLLWDRQEVEEALVQFQKAQGSPRHRKSATLHKGKCFVLKEQYDIAIKEFESLLSEIPEMNKEKLEVLYELAHAYKSLGNEEKSMEFFKEIYQEDVSFRDIQDIMDSFYKK
jgi:tetratricopeptide (TPR) repeat protein